jgi:MFS family permease
MRRNIAAGTIGTVWIVAVYGLPLPLFMQAIHATGFQLGLMNAVRQAAMFAQLPSAFIVERLHARKPFWARVAIIHRTLWLTPALLPLLWPAGERHWVVVLIVALGLSDMLGNVSNAPWLSWMADLLPANRAGRFWGARQRFVSASVFVAAISYGWILDTASHRSGGSLIGFTVVFALAAACGVGDILVHLGVAEPPQSRSAPGQSPWRRLLTPLQNRDFRRLTLAMGAWTAALALPGYYNGVPGFFNVVYLHEAFGATYSQASCLILFSALGAILWSRLIGHRIDIFGVRLVAMALAAVGPLFTLLWFFVSPTPLYVPFLGEVPQPVILMSAASLIIGGCFQGMQLCQYRFTQAVTPVNGRTVAMAVHWSSAGVIGSFGALTGGWIKDHIPSAWTHWTVPGGAAFSYFHIIIVLQVLLAWCVVLPLLASTRTHRQEG